MSFDNVMPVAQPGDIDIFVDGDDREVFSYRYLFKVDNQKDRTHFDFSYPVITVDIRKKTRHVCFTDVEFPGFGAKDMLAGLATVMYQTAKNEYEQYRRSRSYADTFLEAVKLSEGETVILKPEDIKFYIYETASSTSRDRFYEVPLSYVEGRRPFWGAKEPSGYRVPGNLDIHEAPVRDFDVVPPIIRETADFESILRPVTQNYADALPQIEIGTKPARRNG